MSGNHCSRIDLLERIHGFVVAGEGSELADDRWSDFERLLRESDEACRLYAEYMDVSIFLPFVLDTMPDEEFASVDVFSSKPPESVILPSFPAFFSTTIHNTLGYFSEGMPLAYVLATVITGLGLLVGSLIHVSQPEQVACSSVPAVVVERKAEYVGQITGIADCKWNGSSRVSLGQKCELASGLLEITYDTGAKVILQGPVTYEVESNGGYLSIGRLTGKLEEGSGFRVQGSEAANHKSEIINQKSSLSTIHYPLFTIRTPTATVTDLGTEFGVEVSGEGVTETQVFVGSVKVRMAPVSAQSHSVKEQIIHAGGAIRVDGGGNRATTIQPSAGRFVRSLRSRGQDARAQEYAELVLSMKPAVYYRMEEWPNSDKKGCYVLVDSAPGGHHGEYHLDSTFGQPECRGKFGGGLELRGPMVGDYAIVPDYPQSANRQLSVSAWVWAKYLEPWASIIQNWWYPGRGQFFFGIDDHYVLVAQIRVDTDGEPISVAESGVAMMPRKTWQHVAFVADGKALRLYRNGVPVGVSPCAGPDPKSMRKGLAIGLNPNEAADGSKPGWPGFWRGRLDEIAVFNHALTANQVWQLYAGSATAAKPVAAQAAASDKSRDAEPPTGEEGGSDKH